MGSRTRRQIAFAVGVGLIFLLTYLIVYSLSHLGDSVIPEIYLHRMALCLVAFALPVFTTWWRFKWIGVNILILGFLIPMVLFIVSITKFPVFFWSFLVYGGILVILYRVEQYFETHIAMVGIEQEKYQDELNNLEVTFKAKGEGISTFFEKYSTYYNLRKLAEELTVSLSWGELAQKTVDRSMDFIPRGDYSKVTLAYAEERKLPVVARRRMRPVGSWSAKQGDIFDFWCIKNRRRLIVMDSQEDFRFVLGDVEKKENIRSLIVAPLFHEGRVMGTLAIHATRPNVFSHDDLRLLDAIATLASSAISNAMLYEKTEELAIKDALTGLFVRRYFFDRLKEEHRRTLLNKKTMSLLMCDLDHFKECNDRFGHQGGDLMLVQFSEILQKNLKNVILARYGGEEFAVLLPETEKAEALKVAEQVRKAVEKTSFFIRREQVNMTVSVGLANLPDDTMDLEVLVQKADQALYRAKREGRNRVCVSIS
ncbi:MAG TPA: diguanylate cyclase [Candidatus Omnitrophota bacterium]|nr:diguanylate cyclase [Candidatus Omnitrophota bacterium]